MATKFTPINQSQRAAEDTHVPSKPSEVSPDSPPMSPLSPPPSWFNVEDMECPHTPTRNQSPPMSPFSSPPSWFNDEDMECPHTPYIPQSSPFAPRARSSSSVAPLGNSLLLQLENSPLERYSSSPVFPRQALTPSTLMFPSLRAPALQQSVRPAARKRGFVELGTDDVEHRQKVAHREILKTKKTKKTSGEGEDTGLVTPPGSNASESRRSSTTSQPGSVGKPDEQFNQQVEL